MNFIFYLIIIFGIDIVLKGVRAKRRVEKERMMKGQELRDDLREDLNSTVEKIKDKKIIENRNLESNKNVLNHKTEEKIDEFCGQYREYKFEEGPKKYDINKTSRKESKKEKYISDREETEKSNLRKELLKGVIYSEILSEPKSIQNYKKSM